jgi:intergrase/recombinase
MKQNVCRNNKFGYCKFSDKCCFRHNNKTCTDKNCNIVKCDKRDPKICKYQRDYGRCKFTEYCRFNHNDVPQNSDKIDSLENKISKMEEKSARTVTMKILQKMLN